MVVRGRWRPTRRNIVPIVDSLSVVHPAPFSTTGHHSPHIPFRHLIYLLFLNTFVEQFVIARCRLGTCAKQTGWERISSDNEERERMMRKIRGWKEDAGRKRGRMKRMANVPIQAELATELLKLTNSSLPSNSRERKREMTRRRGSARRGEHGVNERNGEFRTKFRHCEMTRVVFIAATPAERDASALSASSFFLRVLTKVSVGLSASRSFVAPFSDITAPSRPLAQGRMRRVIATKSLRGIEEVPQLRTHKT